MLAMKLPRINHAKLVVIPQLGQGKPVRSKKPHSGNPSPRCVPSPSAFGVSSAAMIRRAKLIAETVAARNLSPIDSRAAGSRNT
jgi:hypothetical protein